MARDNRVTNCEQALWWNSLLGHKPMPFETTIICQRTLLKGHVDRQCIVVSIWIRDLSQ